LHANLGVNNGGLCASTHRNMAWQYFLASSHEYFIISNNDVLIPDGVIDKLAIAMNPQGAHSDFPFCRALTLTPVGEGASVNDVVLPGCCRWGRRAPIWQTARLNAPHMGFALIIYLPAPQNP
jgi:hypothetical protein